jgi:hypothetical protein
MIGATLTGQVAVGNAESAKIIRSRRGQLCGQLVDLVNQGEFDEKLERRQSGSNNQ